MKATDNEVELDEARTLGAVGAAGFTTPLRIRQDVDLGLVRVNYRFGGPIVAKY